MRTKKILYHIVNIVLSILLLCILSCIFFFLAAVIAVILSPIIESDGLDVFLILGSFILAIFVTVKIVKFLRKTIRSGATVSQTLSEQKVQKLEQQLSSSKEAAAAYKSQLSTLSKEKNRAAQSEAKALTAVTQLTNQLKEAEARTIYIQSELAEIKDKSTASEELIKELREQANSAAIAKQDVPKPSSYQYSDELFPDAVEVTLESKVVSAGRLQSTLQIGSIHAKKLIEEMEELGIIGPSRGNLPREIFVSQDEWYRAVKKHTPKPVPQSEPPKGKALFCSRCGKQIALDSKYCPSCGAPTVPVAIAPPVQETSSVSNTSKKRCPRCRGHNVSHETVVESNSAGCFTCIFYLILALTFWGLLIVIPLMLRSRTKTVTYAVCQDCGHRWRSY